MSIIEAMNAFKTLNPTDPLDNKLMSLLDEDIREFFSSYLPGLVFLLSRNPRAPSTIA